MRIYLVFTIACSGEEQVVKAVLSNAAVAKKCAADLVHGRVHNARVEEWEVDGSPGAVWRYGDDP